MNHVKKRCRTYRVRSKRKNWKVEPLGTDPDQFRCESLVIADNLNAIRIKIRKHCIRFDSKSLDAIRYKGLVTVGSWLIDDDGVIVENTGIVSESRLVEELKTHRNDETTKKLEANGGE